MIRKTGENSFEYNGITFSSYEAAKLYADSRAGKNPPPVSGIEKPNVGKILSALIAAFMVAWLVSCVFSPKSGSESAKHFGSTESGALTLCQMALKSASRDPDTAEVPYVSDNGSSGEFYFAWGVSTKPVRMKNGFGAILSAGASCIVNKKTGKITSLTLDGKALI